MIDSHSKKLLSRARSHLTQVNGLNFRKNVKNLRKLPKIFENGQKVAKIIHIQKICSVRLVVLDLAQILQVLEKF
jgi:hypothetical protein